MRNKSLIYCFFVLNLLFAINASGQRVPSVRGYLADSLSKTKINDVSISVYIKANLIVQTQSDKLGSFTIPLKVRAGNAIIKFSHINYFNKEISVDIHNSVINLGQIVLIQKAINLKEVNIVSNPIVSLKRNKDTLEVDLSKHTFERYTMTNRALEIVPGIKIVDSKVFFNGDEISNVKVDERNFVFDNRFLMQNLPGFTISKVQIIEETNSNGNKQKRLNIVLKKNQKRAYMFDGIVSNGTSASKWGALTGAHISNLYQVGLRIQSNNLNQLSDSWDVASISKINNLEGQHKIGSIEFSGSYQLPKHKSIEIKYLGNNHISNNNQTNLIIDRQSQAQSFLTNNIRNDAKSNILNIIFRNRIDTITNLSIRSDVRISNANAENSSNYLVQDIGLGNTINFKSQKLFKGKEGLITFNFNKLRKSSKNTFYDFEIKATANASDNDDHYINISGDSLLTRSTGTYSGLLNYKMNFDFNKYSSIQIYTNNDLNSFSSSKVISPEASVNIITLQNKLGLKYILNRNRTIIGADFAASRYNLRYNKSTSYNILISNVNWEYSLKSGRKVRVEINNDYNLPSIMQLTGIASSGQQQTINIQANNELMPEQKFDLNLRYLFKKHIRMDWGFSHISNKIDNILLNDADLIPIIKYVNSGNTKSFITSITDERSVFKNKITITNSFGAKFYMTNSYFNNTFLPNKMVQLSYNFTSICDSLRNFHMGFTTQIVKLHYEKGIYPDNFMISNRINVRYNYKDLFSVSTESEITRSYNKIHYNNNSTNFNIVVGKTIFKSRRCMVFTKVNNLFNSVMNQIVISSVDRLQYTNSNNLGRYYLFGINYKFSKFK